MSVSPRRSLERVQRQSIIIGGGHAVVCANERAHNHASPRHERASERTNERVSGRVNGRASESVLSSNVDSIDTRCAAARTHIIIIISSSRRVVRSLTNTNVVSSNR